MKANSMFYGTVEDGLLHWTDYDLAVWAETDLANGSYTTETLLNSTTRGRLKANYSPTPTGNDDAPKREPVPEAPVNAHRTTVKEFKQLLEPLVRIVDKKALAPVLTGVWFDQNSQYAYTTDRYRLHRIPLGDLPFTGLWPVEFLPRAYKWFTPTTPVRVWDTDTHAFIQSDAVTVRFPKLEGEFPNVSKLWPDDVENWGSLAELDPKTFKSFKNSRVEIYRDRVVVEEFDFTQTLTNDPGNRPEVVKFTAKYLSDALLASHEMFGVSETKPVVFGVGHLLMGVR